MIEMVTGGDTQAHVVMAVEKRENSCLVCHGIEINMNHCDLGSVPTTPEKFENAALFLRSSLPSTIIRHQKGTFRKRSSNRGNLKTQAVSSRVSGKHFENAAFQNDGAALIT